MEQLTYAGVFEAVAIRKTGYPFRLTHTRFANRYDKSSTDRWRNVSLKSCSCSTKHSQADTHKIR